MTRFVQEIDIAAAPERVWSVLSRLEDWPGWTASMRAVRALGEGPPRAGARYRVEQPRLRPADFTITEWDEPRSFTWRMRSPGVGAVAVHAITPTPAGCRVRLEVRYTGPLAVLVALLAGGLTRDYMRLEAEGLRRRSEAGD